MSTVSLLVTLEIIGSDKMKLAILLFFLFVTLCAALQDNRNIPQIKADWEGFKVREWFGAFLSGSVQAWSSSLYERIIKENTLSLISFHLQAKFGKSYSGSEDSERMRTYLDNLKEINSHNELFKRGVVSWTKDVTQFTDITKENFKNLLGSGPPPDDDDDDDEE